MKRVRGVNLRPLRHRLPSAVVADRGESHRPHCGPHSCSGSLLNNWKARSRGTHLGRAEHNDQAHSKPSKYALRMIASRQDRSLELKTVIKDDCLLGQRHEGPLCPEFKRGPSGDLALVDYQEKAATQLRSGSVACALASRSAGWHKSAFRHS